MLLMDSVGRSWRRFPAFVGLNVGDVGMSAVMFIRGGPDEDGYLDCLVRSSWESMVKHGHLGHLQVFLRV